VRLLVCLEEADYLDWISDSEGVLAALGATNPDRGHILVRTGTLLDSEGGYLERTWAGGDGSDDRLEVLEAWKTRRVGAMYLEGVSHSTLPGLVARLGTIPGLIGLVDVTREPRTGFLLQNKLPLRYRIVGANARVLHTFEDLAGDMDEVHGVRERIEGLGVFGTVTLEDIGVRDTLFDASTNDVHRALRVSEIVAFAADVEHAEAGVMWLDVYDFRLTDALHAATRACSTATYAEEAAQGALSSRRFLEQLANVLFPPQPGLRKGRAVGPAEWRNRLWAAIEDALGPAGDPTELARLGGLVDEIKDAADTGVHRIPPISPADAVELLERLLGWLYDMARLIPPPPSSSLDPYEEGILEVMLEMFAADDDDE
jgi:hypothetical protein